MGIIGLFLIFVTWVATRQAASVSRESAKDGVRAYVEVKEVSCSGGVIGTVVNTGATPAKWFEVGAVSKAIEVTYNIDWDAHIDFSEVEKFQRWPVLTDKHTANLIAKNEAATIAKVRGSKSLHMLVYGTVRYETIFGEELETEFAFITNLAAFQSKMERVPGSIKTFQPVIKKKR